MVPVAARPRLVNRVPLSRVSMQRASGRHRFQRRSVSDRGYLVVLAATRHPLTDPAWVRLSPVWAVTPLLDFPRTNW